MTFHQPHTLLCYEFYPYNVIKKILLSICWTEGQNVPKFQLLSFGRLGMRAFLRWVMTTAMIYVQVLLVLIQVHAQMKEQRRASWCTKKQYAPACKILRNTKLLKMYGKNMTYNEKFKWHKSTSNISIKAQMCSNTYAAHFSKHERWSAKCAENNVHHNMRGTNCREKYCSAKLRCTKYALKNVQHKMCSTHYASQNVQHKCS